MDDQLHEATVATPTISRGGPLIPLELEGDDAIFRSDAISLADEHRRRKDRRCSILPALLVIAALIVVAVVTSVLFPRKGNKISIYDTTSHPTTKSAATSSSSTASPSFVPNPVSTPSPSPNSASAPTVPRLEAFWNLLLNHSISSEFFLHEPSSPQYQALTWIANDDAAQLNVATTPSDVIITRYILAALYFNNGGAEWTVNTNFLSGESVCAWKDFTNETGVISCDPLRIHLADNNLMSTILIELGRLSTLQYLDLSFNVLNGTIPTQLAMLSSLTYLSLGYNSFQQQSLFNGVESMTNLQHLNLTSDQLSGELPTVLSQLSSLQQLDLSSNSFHGTIPNNLGLLKQLQALDLSANNFSGTVPSSLAHLSSLSSLSVQYNSNITGNMTPYFCDRSWTVLGSDCAASSVDCFCCTCYSG